MKNVLLKAAIALPLLAALASAQEAKPAEQHPGGGEVHILKVQGNIYMLVGAGGNIAVSVGNDGVLLVDTGLANMSDKVIAAIRTLSTKPIHYIINTHVHADHTGGNEAIAKIGTTIVGGNVTGDIADAGQGAAVIAQETVLDRMSAPTGKQSAMPQGAWPTDTYTEEKNMYFNGEGIQIMHQPAAHTDGDSLVYFRRSDVVVTGDIFTPERYPIIDLQRGGSINGIIAGLNHLIDITIPASKQEGGTYIIPGHGRLCDQADLVFYQEMVTIIRDRVQASIKKGMTMEQVVASKPTRDYDPVFGATTGFWTRDKFVEAVYKSLSGEK
ncbi:MAG TPA: MBL fold metallo-hydrolase [Bryobacteraceae bacterium]|nr:MBL fold metallo-hydrolase [Bryobacteraceae bacterium]